MPPNLLDAWAPIHGKRGLSRRSCS
jgi:hypothetical protein